jgi:hypothetical protein
MNTTTQHNFFAEFEVEHFVSPTIFMGREVKDLGYVLFFLKKKKNSPSWTFGLP